MASARPSTRTARRRPISLPIRLLIAASAIATLAAAPDDARKVHDAAIVLDSHFDTPANLGRPGWSIIDRHSFAEDGDQVDWPRMVDSGVDGGFFAIFTGQGARDEAGDHAARDAALVRAVQIREMVAKHSDKFALALTADDARRIAAEGKRIVFISMENGSPFAGDLSLMRTFRALGATTMGAVHTRNNDLADSATDKPEWNGLSPKGKQFVADANRLGVLIDASHASDDATLQMAQLSKTPIILTHSGMRGVYNHPRNVPDAVAKAVAAKGGVIQINAFSGYMIDQQKIPERDAAMAELRQQFGRASTPEQRRAMIAKRKEIDARWPVKRATFDDVIKHIVYAVRLVGIDHVGISGDFDGGGGVEGLDDITGYPNVTAALLKAGFSQSDVNKFWGGNALRAIAAAQAAAEPGAVPAVPVTR
ncbi:dipeptidase [Sphingomonas sp.]|uniref:dipeptidase n=1 Tax=Sphingomonas sp. TaxID=28214 RepID=UPI002B78ED67|nr:dipeptidase [Sphingomonas sp.]HWK35898.1 dipeptidase [Sphingomonas sp.]